MGHASFQKDRSIFHNARNKSVYYRITLEISLPFPSYYFRSFQCYLPTSMSPLVQPMNHTLLRPLEGKLPEEIPRNVEANPQRLQAGPNVFVVVYALVAQLHHSRDYRHPAPFLSLNLLL